MEALEEIVQQGKARFVGLSNFTIDEIKTCMDTRRVDVIQYACNLFDRRMAKWIFPYAQENGIGVMNIRLARLRNVGRSVHRRNNI